MQKEIIVGCDVGTGSCKAIAMDVSGEIVAESQHYYNVLHPQPRFSEQDPQIIWNAFEKCITEICKKSKPTAISLSSCMHSLILMDAEGNALTPLITWEDSRSHKIASNLRAFSKGKKIYKQTGTPVHSMSPLCKIAWFKKNRKKIFSKTAYFIGIKEFLWYRLFGVFQVDYSVASATGLFNIHELVWNKPSLQFCGVDENRLPQLVPTTFIRNDASKTFLSKTGLEEGTKFCIGASDGCLANVGSGIDSKYKAAVTIGTSGAVRINSPVAIEDYNSMIFNYVLDKKTFVCGGPANNGGNVLQWLLKTFLNNDDPKPGDYDTVSKKIGEIAAGSDGIICLPYLFGERAPVWDENASAIWFGVKASHTKYHFIRAALEGICFGLNSILENIEKSAFEIKTLHVSGGFIHSESWVQMLCDITGKKMILNENGDASSIGAARWAMKALKMKSVPLNKQDEEIITPNPANNALYQKYFKSYKRLYKLNREEMHRLL